MRRRRLRQGVTRWSALQGLVLFGSSLGPLVAQTTSQAPLPSPALPPTKVTQPRRISPGSDQLPEILRKEPITLENAVSLALALNRSLALAEEALFKAQGRTSETRTAFNPTLNGTATFTQLDQGTTFDLGGQTITIVPSSQRQFGAQVVLPLDISGLLQTTTQQAQFLEIATRLDVNRTRNQVVQDVKAAFYDVLRAQALVAVATRAQQNAQDRLEDAEKKFKEGVAARFDVIRAQTDVANARQSVIQARSGVTLAIAQLNNTIGLDIATPLQLSEKGALVEIESPSNAEPSSTTLYDSQVLGKEYDGVVAEALKLRPEIWQAEASLAAAKKGIQLAHRSQLPTMALSAGINYAPDTAGFSPRKTTGQLIASLTVPIFEGGAARARLQQARADVATAETNRRQTADLVTLEVRQAYLTLVQAQNRVVVAKQALTQAQEGFRLARVRYNAGVSTLIEVSDAQTALTQAENNLVSAQYDYHTARVRLDKAAGRYGYVSNGAGYAAPPKEKLPDSTKKEAKR